MYDYTTYKDFIATIRSTSDIRTFLSAVRGYLNDSAMRWWHGLQENERQAIILLDFNPSVVTTIVFFGRDRGFGGGYTDVMEAILEKADLLANEKELSNWDSDFLSVIYHARAQARAEHDVRTKAAAIAQEMNLIAGYNTLENLLIKNSGTVRKSKKRKVEDAKEMRKAILSDALNYLRKNYDTKKEGE